MAVSLFREDELNRDEDYVKTGTIFHITGPCEGGINRSHHKGPVMWSVDVFFVQYVDAVENSNGLGRPKNSR